LKKDIIKDELGKVKNHTHSAKKFYTDKFLEKSLLLKMDAKQAIKTNSKDNRTNVYVNISITNTFSKKLKKYRILMFRLKNNKNLKIKKYDYNLLNKFLNLILCENEFALILFLFKHIKRIKQIPNKDYSMHYFIIFFVIMMILALIAGICIGHIKDIYFHRI